MKKLGMAIFLLLSGCISYNSEAARVRGPIALLGDSLSLLNTGYGYYVKQSIPGGTQEVPY